MTYISIMDYIKIKYPELSIGFCNLLISFWLC